MARLRLPLALAAAGAALLLQGCVGMAVGAAAGAAVGVTGAAVKTTAKVGVGTVKVAGHGAGMAGRAIVPGDRDRCSRKEARRYPESCPNAR